MQGAVARYQAEAAPQSSLVAAVTGGDHVVVTGSRTVALPVSRLLGIGPLTVRARAEVNSGQLGAVVP